jgi:hypothetical protein
MKFKKLIFAGVFALAITTSFAFKANSHQQKGQFVDASGWDNDSPWECDGLLTADDTCSPIGTGAQCQAFINPAEGYTPAYEYGTENCTYPLYQPF